MKNTVCKMKKKDKKLVLGRSKALKYSIPSDFLKEIFRIILFIHRPINEHHLPDNHILIDKTKIPAVCAVIKIIANYEVMIFLDNVTPHRFSRYCYHRSFYPDYLFLIFKNN